MHIRWRFHDTGTLVNHISLEIEHDGCGPQSMTFELKMAEEFLNRDHADLREAVARAKEFQAARRNKRILLLREELAKLEAEAKPPDAPTTVTKPSGRSYWEDYRQ